VSEEWLPVVGLEGSYEVSNTGKVRSIDRVVSVNSGYIRPLKGVLLKGFLVNGGYLQVDMHINGERIRRLVHSLVSESFIGNSDLTVDHIDGDKLNNKVENLEYVTQRENIHRYRKGKRDLPIGVSFCRDRNKYRAEIYIDGRSRHIGRYTTPEEAREAYLTELKSIGEKEE